jgi:hypothetical protein
MFVTGLQDFAWYNITKWVKFTKIPQHTPNGRKYFN